jgi:hypothetical protein
LLEEIREETNQEEERDGYLESVAAWRRRDGSR